MECGEWNQHGYRHHVTEQGTKEVGTNMAVLYGHVMDVQPLYNDPHQQAVSSKDVAMLPSHQRTWLPNSYTEMNIPKQLKLYWQRSPMTIHHIKFAELSSL